MAYACISTLHYIISHIHMKLGNFQTVLRSMVYTTFFCPHTLLSYDSLPYDTLYILEAKLSFVSPVLPHIFRWKHPRIYDKLSLEKADVSVRLPMQ